MSYLINGQWTAVKNKRKYRPMSVLPFPVCAYAAIHYKERQQLGNWILKKEEDWKYNKIHKIELN